MLALSSPLFRELVVTPNGFYGAPRPKRNDVHKGLDFEADKGDLVAAAAAGKVARVGVDPPRASGGGGGGNFVILSHTLDGNKWETGYMHLSDVFAKAGDDVVAGEVIGKAGATGTDSGAVHLHFQLYSLIAGARAAVDPTPLLPIAKKRSSGSSAIWATIGTALVGWAVYKVLG